MSSAGSAANGGAASAATPASSRDRRIQPRHFHDGRNPLSGDDMLAEVDEVAALPAVARLYRHALESIFAFCDLRDLHALMSVSHSWQSAVLSMPSHEWNAEDISTMDRLASMCASRLRRHVSIVGRCNALDRKINLNAHTIAIMLLTDRMPALSRLAVSIDPSSAPMQFPGGLVELSLGLLSDSAHIAAKHAEVQFNSAMQAISSLRNLKDLIVIVGCWQSEWNLAPLARLPLLRRFILHKSNSDIPLQLTDAQVLQVLTLADLDTLNINGVQSLSASAVRLLPQPHQLRWKELGGTARLSSEVAEFLIHLPLTRLNACYLSMPHADFLLQLPELTELSLGSSDNVMPDIPRIFNSLATCTQLQSLELYDDVGPHDMHFTSVHLSTCLAQLKSLHTLALVGATQLTTLAFLAEGTLPLTLTNLACRSFYPRLPVAEVKHVLALHELKSLKLASVFVTALDAAGLLLFQPPMQPFNMPNLRSFEHQWTALPAHLAAAGGNAP